jgi:hypothetical protein
MMMNLTRSALADFILISFLVIIAITLIIDRIRIIVIEISREIEKRRYEEQRRKGLLMCQLPTTSTGGGSQVSLS